ncbi:molybdenum ABC transporter ATP-binding protein [Pacificimonas flava]|uniref:Molybdenum ABC transporter ATP-binding protein n=2 Tax=Pacificimonas TaxID=1960290 RepID=A0A219B674_9SPHN|nr:MULTISPECIES: ATP-binding cassette domain-containing protein [Pacificimonas]MBZ6379159.1 ATP-binding cassette domain-containing protein [Pacificimonas aurantium]OWV33616.1 molybdenum ABC transporter ATP-binding protein [Pacificimonas flava]
MSFDIDIEVARGERVISCAFRTGDGITCLVGPSGAGKTTILSAVAGLARPRRGHIVVRSRTLFAPGIDLPPEKRHCGYVFQDARLFPHMRVRENLDFARRPRFDRNEIAESLGIAHLLARWPRTLSGGETRRVAIARALLANSDFLLFDEPLVSLDPPRAEEIAALIRRVHEDYELPVLYVTHDRSEAKRLGARLIDFEGNEVA